MKYEQFFLILAAIYVTPHIPKNGGLFAGLVCIFLAIAEGLMK